VGKRRESKSKRTQAQPGPVRGWRIAFLVLCTVGLCFQADLARLHVNVHTDPDYQSYCAMSERLNCETVASSDSAVFLDLPLAVWGLLAYLAMGGLAAWGLRARLRVPTWPFGLLFGASLFATALSVYLYYISHYIVGSICIVCVGSYIVNLLLLAVAFLELRRCRVGALRALVVEWRSLAARPGSFVGFATTFVGLAVALWIGVPRYWKVELPSGHRGEVGDRTAEGHPWLGARFPVLDIVEYSDYQCPHCRRGHEEVRALVQRHPDAVRLVHRNYPLDHHCNPNVHQPFHPWSCAYARLAFCAGEQGKFWPANDYLFMQGRRRQAVGPGELASSIGADAALMSECADSERARRAVESDMTAGRALGIRGTPTFVIDGKSYPGRIPPDVIASALEGKSPTGASP
jgi:uncharacterized membrane protein